MKKEFAAIVSLILFLVACGASDQAAVYSGEEQTYEHSYENNGMELIADIHVDQDIIVDTTITNKSGNPIIYNGRCGIPFYISMEMEGTSARLNSDQEDIACDAIFDPDDLESFEAEDTIEKTVTFTREFGFIGDGGTPAHEGDYTIDFSYETHELGQLATEYPIKLNHDTEPEILTRKEAEEKALKHNEVSNWHHTQKENELEVVTEDAILSEGNWHIKFHAIDEKIVNRIIVAVDYDSGDITNVNTETHEMEKGMEEYLEVL